jgi:uncharacterized protein YcbX
MTVQLSQLIIYPVKSLAGIVLQHSELDEMGLKYDRRWMIVDKRGKFITQRSHPHMALIQPELNHGDLILHMQGRASHQVPDASSAKQKMPVRVWSDTVNAVHLGDTTDTWLTTIIGEPCHLVYIPDDEYRQCDLAYAQRGDRTGFADGFPLLLISEASLNHLNTKLDCPVEMIRFRPNLVVSGCEAHAEDQWKQIQISDIGFRIVKPCSRCPIPTVNPQSGTKEGPEPLKTLLTYRRKDNQVYFGQNIIHDSTGILAVGSGITIS